MWAIWLHIVCMHSIFPYISPTGSTKQDFCYKHWSMNYQYFIICFIIIYSSGFAGKLSNISLLLFLPIVPSNVCERVYLALVVYMLTHRFVGITFWNFFPCPIAFQALHGIFVRQHRYSGSEHSAYQFFFLTLQCMYSHSTNNVRQARTKSNEPISLLGRCFRWRNSLEAFSTIRGRPSISTTDEKIQQVREVIMVTRRVIID